MTVLWFETALLSDGWASGVRLSLRDGAIASVERNAEPEAGDERHAIALPGLASLHSHAFQRAMAGLAERRGPGQDSFWSWREVMYGFALRMSPDQVEAVAAELYCEMLEAGFTRVGEFHYLHHDTDGRPYAEPAEMGFRIASAANSTGLGLTLLPAFYAHAGFGGDPAGPGQRRFASGLDLYGRVLEGAERAVKTLPRGAVGLAPHSLRAVTPEELAHLTALAGARPIHIHVAEQTAEVEQCLAWSGKRPVEWLLDAAPVGPQWCLIHATHMTPDETRRAARSGAVAGLCPITEANLGDGIFEAVEFTAAGGAWGIGSDSNVEIGAAEELRLFEYSQRLRHRARNVMAEPGHSTGRALFDAALAGGHAALGQPSGALAAGAPADLVTLDASHPALVAAKGDAILDTWIFSGGKALVDSVWVAGRRVVTSGRHAGREAIRARFRAAMASLST